MLQLFRFVAAKWAVAQGLKPTAFEGKYTFEKALEFNTNGYNVYYFPNHPSDETYNSIPVNPNSNHGRKLPVNGTFIDVFKWVFIDLDMKNYQDGTAKSHNYATKDEFIEKLLTSGLTPTRIVDSGGGIHAYWRMSDLDAMGFLRLNRRMARFFSSDIAVGTLNQLMRVPGTLNVKNEENFVICETLFEAEENMYDSEVLDKFLPSITTEDEEYCVNHYNMVHNVNSDIINISEELPIKFLKLCKSNLEVKSLFYDQHKDRSSADFRLGHLMYAAGLTKEEARIPLMQTSKSSERTKVHRYSYAENIVNKIWSQDEVIDKSDFKMLSRSMVELRAVENVKEGTRFTCHPLIDATERGFRLGDVLGLIGGQGNGKSSISLNIFLWFIERNPDYIHLYVSLEQPEREIAVKWDRMTKDMPDSIHSRVHVLGNYDENGMYRDLSFKDIKDYIKGLEKHTGKKVGCCTIDHIGIIKQEKKNDEFSGLMGVCKQLKSFAIETNTFLLIQSQTTREKNGGGDLELDLDAAFGTSQFESYVDYVFTCWQPLKRIYKKAPHMTVNAFKLCKNRHKNVLKDKIQADTIYALKYEPDTERLREMTSDEHRAYDFWQSQATALRNRDKKTEPNQVVIIDWIPNKKVV